jgi:hypothetical protein
MKANMEKVNPTQPPRIIAKGLRSRKKTSEAAAYRRKLETSCTRLSIAVNSAPASPMQLKMAIASIFDALVRYNVNQYRVVAALYTLWPQCLPPKKTCTEERPCTAGVRMTIPCCKSYPSTRHLTQELMIRYALVGVSRVIPEDEYAAKYEQTKWTVEDQIWKMNHLVLVYLLFRCRMPWTR